MNLRASSAAALLPFLLAAKTPIPEPKPDKHIFEFQMIDKVQSIPISDINFTVYQDEECIKPLNEKKSHVDEEGKASFETDLEECWLRIQSVPGYYLQEEPFKLVSEKENVLELEPIQLQLEIDEEELPVQIIEENKVIQHISSEEDKVKLTAGNTYYLHADSKEPNLMFEDQEIEIPQFNPGEPLHVKFEKVPCGYLHLKLQPAYTNAEVKLWLNEACDEPAMHLPICFDEDGETDISLKEGIYYLRYEEIDPLFYLNKEVQQIEIKQNDEIQKELVCRPVRYSIHTYDADDYQDIDLLLKRSEKEYSSNTWIPGQRGQKTEWLVQAENSEYDVPEKINVEIPIDAEEDIEIQYPLRKKQVPVETEVPVPTNTPEPTVEPISPVIEAPEPAPLLAEIHADVPEGVQWTLYYDEAGTKQAAGSALPYGTYYVKSENAPAGYYPKNGLFPIQAASPSSTFSIPFTKASLSVDCQYQDEKERNAVIGIYDEKGKLLEKWKADGTKVIEKNIFPGQSYIIKVLNSSSDLQAEPALQRIQIPEKEPTAIPSVHISLNHTVRMEIQAGNDKKKTANIKYAVYEDPAFLKPVTDQMNQPLTVETNEKGKATVDLQEGTYYLKPLETPKHWIEEDQPIKVDVEKKNSTVMIDQEEVAIYFHLKNEDGNYVSGSSFSLLDETGKPVYEWTTGQDMVKISDEALERGKIYVLHEKRSASGYQRITDQKVEIPLNVSEPIVVELHKEKTKPIQKIIEGTGEKQESKRYVLLTAGGIALAAAMALLIALKKRNNFENEKKQ